MPVQEEIIKDIKLSLKDKTVQKIFTYQDRAQADSLYSYFSHVDPTYRYCSAMAFASIRDSNSINRLAYLLKDPNQEVRIAAAFAIGQTGNSLGENFLLNNFERSDSTRRWQLYNQAVLEAVGKCGTDNSLKFLSEIKTYTEKDTFLIVGQALGIYRFALRNKILTSGTKRMVQLLQGNYPPEAQFIASSYLGRIRPLNLDTEAIQTLIRRINNTSDYRVKMNIALALGKVNSPIAKDELLSIYERETDHRVKTNIIRALGNYSYAEVQRIAFQALKDPNVQVSKAAAQFFIDHGEGTDGTVYWRLANDASTVSGKLMMLKAANRHVSAIFEEANLNINNQIKGIFADTTRAMSDRIGAISALSEYNWNFRYIYRNAQRSENPILKSAAMEAIGHILSDSDFDKKFGLGKTSSKKEMSVFITEAINNGDAGTKAVAANILADTTIGIYQFFDNSSFLHVAKRKLKLPQETETLYALNEAIMAFDKTSIKNEKPNFNYPIDWTIFDKTEAEIKARIETKKGDIILDLFPLSAPGSVANFIKLADAGFYDGKNVHRMVPNFVIQGGCPRGDGYGSLDYSLRTEISNLVYHEEGMLGMASAGADTEGVQWFITHSSTPHLDGRYTIFGKVANGMDVVHRIEVGDVIKTIKILK